MPDDSELISVLESLRARGALGEPSIPGAIAHSESFVAALPTDCRRVIDLGSGGGLPGLIIGVRRPDVELVLTDRRERRVDLLHLACSQLRIQDHVSVVAGDVVELATRDDFREAFDAVTARSFGHPLWTLECAAPFLAVGREAIVSEPPPDDSDGHDGRWPMDQVRELGFVMQPPVAAGQVRSFVRV